MGIRKYKPTTPGLRGMTVSTFEEITTDKPEKSLTVTLKKHSGRNVRGKITVRHRGGGYRPKYRIIDFKRQKDDIPATVKTIEYDPNRTANIALLVYADGEKRYIIAPNGLKVGDVVESGPNADIKPGNALPIANIPLGTIIHNIELKPGKGGQLVRAAGNGAQLMAKEGEYAQVRLPSGEVRMVRMNCRATVGEVGNPVCGDIMKMYLKIEDDRIADVKFKTFGCGSAIATSSMATELIKGKTLEEALDLTNKAVVDALDGLPARKIHCSVLAEDAIKAALVDYYTRSGKEMPESLVGFEPRED